jgi:hypothetical protein
LFVVLILNTMPGLPRETPTATYAVPIVSIITSTLTVKSKGESAGWEPPAPQHLQGDP